VVSLWALGRPGGERFVNERGAVASAGAVGSSFVEGEWEYQPVRLPPDVTRISATVQLGIQAEFGGWELSRTLLYADGTRKVWLRRKRTRALQAGLAT
jgi:hypothetical protein